MFACVCVGRTAIRYGCIDRCDPDDRDFLISAIAIVANLVTATIAIIAPTVAIIGAIIAPTVAIIWAIDVTLIGAATIAIVVVMIEIVGIYNLGF